MTLVLGCATANYIVQVCDRWITRRGAPSPVETDRNKGIFVQGRYVFSYSGPAWVNNTPTDIWLAKLLAHPPEKKDDWLSEITSRLANAIPEGESFACSGFGWVDGPDGSRECLHVVFSNAMDVDTGRWDKGPSSQMFCQYRTRKRNQPVLFGIPTGAQINWKQFRATKTLIRRAVANDRAPSAIAQHLLQQIRQSALLDSTVGPDTLVMILPKPGREEFRDTCVPMAHMTPEYDRPVCYVVGHQGKLIDWSGPVFVYDGWVIHPQQKDRASEDYSLVAKVIVMGEGSAGSFIEENGRRINALWGRGGSKPSLSAQSGIKQRHMIGLCCLAQEFIELVPLPDIHALVKRAEPYLLQWECYCQFTSTSSSDEVARWFGWGASFIALAKQYRCQICGGLGARGLRAFSAPGA